MHSAVQSATISKRTLWIGRVVSAVPTALVLFGAIMKLVKAAPLVEGMAQHGIPENLIVLIGVIELVCVVLYVIPSTAVLGAILMTGLFGGATFTNLRVGDPTYAVTIILGVMVWAGLYVREPRLHEILPLRH